MRSLFFFLFASLASASTIYQISVDTTSVSGNAGSIYMQFNPGPGTVAPATASILNFGLTGGTLAAAPDPPNGGVSGTLPGTVTMANSSALNDYFHTLTYGAQLLFQLEVSATPAGGETGGNVFNLFLLNGDGTANVFSSSNVDGVLVGIDLAVDGTPSLSNFNSDVVSAAVVPTGEIPEPATCWLAGGALVLAGAARRKVLL
jgi:hypothetical protein